MAVNINPNNDGFKNPKFVKNMVRSFSTMGKEIFSEYVPEGVKVYNTNKEFVKSVNFKNKKISVNEIKNSDLYKSGKQLISNAIDDLKSGNFYNEERVNKSMQEAAGDVFGIDFSFMDDLESSIGSITNDVETTTDNINGKEVTTTTNKSTLVLNDNMNAINMSFRNMTRVILKNQSLAFSSLNRHFNGLLLFNTENTISFYNNTSNQFLQINNILSTMYKNVDRLGNIELGGLKETNRFNQLNSLLGSSELLSMGYYINRLKPDSFDKSKLSPIMQGIKSALMLAMPPVIKDTLAETNAVIKNLPVMLNQKLGDMKESDNALSRMIGETFHKDLDGKNSKYRIKNQAIGFDGVTRRAIVNVIPQLISKIVNAMRKGSPDDELVYDYNSGGYRTKGDIKKASEMQFQQQIRGVAGFKSDIEKYKQKVMANVAKELGTENGKSVRREIDKSIYKMLKEKQLPIKGGKYSKNDTINNAIVETFLKMSPLEKVDFVNSVTRLTTPQEWLEANESYHNVFNPLEFDDIKKKYDKDHRKELYLYFKSKGMDTLADRVREGDKYNRSENNLSKLNPFYYIVEGLRAGNDIISRTLLSDGKTEVDPDSFIGKLNNKINYIMSKPFSEHVHDLKEKFKQRIGKNPFIEEIRDAGLVTGIKGLFKEASEYIKGEKLDNGNKPKSKLIDKLKEDFVDPIVNIFKQAVTEPIKKQASQLGEFTKNVFTTITEPVKRVYTAYKDKYNSLKAANLLENTSIERAKAEGELRENENQASTEIINEVRANEEKYTELDKSVSRGVLDMVKSIRTDLVNPIDSFATSISLVMKQGDEFVNKVNVMKLDLEYDRANFRAYTMDIEEERMAKDLEGRFIEYQNSISEVNTLITQIEDTLKRAGEGDELDDIDENGEFFTDNSEETTMDKAINFLKKGKNKATEVLGKLQEKLDPGSHTSIVDSFKKLGNKTASTITGVIGNMMDTITKSSGSISKIITNTLKVGESFFGDTLPTLLKTAGAEIKNVASTALEELKNTGSDVWSELKNTGTKVWSTAKNIFSTIGDQIFDFIGRIRQQEFDVYIEGGTLTGIKNTVFYVQPKQTGYQYMQNKFKSEDEDDSKDTDENEDDADNSRETITGRIKERFKFMKDIIKSVAGSALSAAVSGVKNLASSLLSTIGSTLMSVIGPKIASVISKYGGKALNWAKGAITKGKNRTKKGKQNLGKILGKTGSALTTLNGIMSDATPVYVVGGILDGVGDGYGIDDMVEDKIEDKIEDTIEEKLEKSADDIVEEATENAAKEVGEELSEEAVEKMAKEAMEHADDVGDSAKGIKGILKWLSNSKIGKSIGGSTLVKTAKEVLSDTGSGLTKFEKFKKIFFRGGDATKAAKAGGTVGDMLKSLGKTATKAGGTALDLLKSTGTKTVSNVLDMFSLAKAGKIGKAASKALPIVGTIAAIIDIGSDVYKAFTADTWGQKIANGIAAILKVGVEVLDVLCLETGIVSILGGLLVDWLKDKMANAKDGFFNKFKLFKSKEEKEKEKAEKKAKKEAKKAEKAAKKNENGTVATPTAVVKGMSTDVPSNQTTLNPPSTTEATANNIGQQSLNGDKSAVVSSLMAVTAPQAYLAYNSVKKYREFKKREADTEAKFLAKLSEHERDEYLNNKNASIYSSILRTQDGGKMVRTLLNTAILATSMNAGMTEGDILSLLNTSLLRAVRSNANTEDGNYDGNGGTPVYDENGNIINGGGGTGGSSPTPGEDITGETNVANAVWKFFTSRGYSKYATAGIMGNLQQESGMNPNSHQSGGGPGRGIAQWTVSEGRFKGLQAYAQSKGKDWTDLQSQLEWIDMELNGKDSTTASKLNKNFGGINGLKNATDYKWAVEAFERSFERAGKPNYPRRYQYAESFFNKFATSNASYDLANENGSSISLVGNMPASLVPMPTTSIDATTTGRLAGSMSTSMDNLDAVSESINVINNTTFDIGNNSGAILDSAIGLLNNINSNVEASINKETIVEETVSDSKLDNSKNPFVDYTDDNIDLSLRSFSLDIRAILEGI